MTPGSPYCTLSLHVPWNSSPDQDRSGRCSVGFHCLSVSLTEPFYNRNNQDILIISDMIRPANFSKTQPILPWSRWSDILGTEGQNLESHTMDRSQGTVSFPLVQPLSIDLLFIHHPGCSPNRLTWKEDRPVLQRCSHPFLPLSFVQVAQTICGG